jgi:hypothetical protein
VSWSSDVTTTRRCSTRCSWMGTATIRPGTYTLHEGGRKKERGTIPVCGTGVRGGPTVHLLLYFRRPVVVGLSLISIVSVLQFLSFLMTRKRVYSVTFSVLICRVALWLINN